MVQRLPIELCQALKEKSFEAPGRGLVPALPLDFDEATDEVLIVDADSGWDHSRCHSRLTIAPPSVWSIVWLQLLYHFFTRHGIMFTVKLGGDRLSPHERAQATRSEAT